MEVTITPKEYRDLLVSDIELPKLWVEYKALNEKYDYLKRMILEMNVNEHCLKNRTLEECFLLEGYYCGLHNMKKLLEVFSYRELCEFIAIKYKEIHKDDEDGQ